MDIFDATFLVFGQAMPALDAMLRVDVVGAIDAGDYSLALDILLRAVNAHQIPVDHDLLRQATDIHATTVFA